MDTGQDATRPIRRSRRRAAINNNLVNRRATRTPAENNDQTIASTPNPESQAATEVMASTAFPSTEGLAAEILRQMMQKGITFQNGSQSTPAQSTVGLPHQPQLAQQLQVPQPTQQPQLTPQLQLHQQPQLNKQPILQPSVTTQGPSTTFISSPQSVPPVPSTSQTVVMPQTFNQPFDIQAPVSNVVNNLTGRQISAIGSTHGQGSDFYPGQPVNHLTSHVQTLLMQAIAPQTQALYKRAFQSLEQFVLKTSYLQSCLPTTVGTLIYFIAHLNHQGMASSTVSTYTAAIGYINRLAGHPDPTQSFVVKKMLSAIQRGSYRPDTRLPITPIILSKLVESLPHTAVSHYQVCMLRAMYLLAFHAFLRVGEMAMNTVKSHVLQFQDIQIIQTSGRPTKLELTFRSFKGNYNIRPVVLAIHAKQQSSTTCPVTALFQFVQLRGTYPGPLFTFPSNVPVSYQYFSSCLRSSLAWAGFRPNQYTSHSFRIGAASTAAASGVPDEEIQQMGRWKSMAFKRYIRLPTLFDVTTP
ncbi:uncharacterized protein [Argopecten irradians]|uniref:uncharacterized protein n=1 Tax=Argopecten irradians TaxID=31199 RepID=UPI003720C63C